MNPAFKKGDLVEFKGPFPRLGNRQLNTPAWGERKITKYFTIEPGALGIIILIDPSKEIRLQCRVHFIKLGEKVDMSRLEIKVINK